MKKIYTTLIFILHVNLIQAQNPLVKQWDKRFWGKSDDGCSSFQQTADGGYILGGYSISGINGDKTQPLWDTCNCPKKGDYWIVKIDSSGNKQWDKDFGGTGYDNFRVLHQTADGGYILGGYSESGISGDKSQPVWGYDDYWIIKIDSLGNKLWDRRFGGSCSERLTDLQQTIDGGYILGGYSCSGINGDKTQNTWGDYDYWIVKTDSLGNKQWDKDFGGTAFENLLSLQQTTDGGYILGGESFSGISGDKSQATWGNSDFWIVKTDSLGNKEWDKDFGGTKQEGIFFSLQVTPDGGYIFGGLSNSHVSGDKTQNTKGSYDYWIVKIDSLGNKQWDKDFGGTLDEMYDKIFQTADGGYLISGSSNSNISGDKTEVNLGPTQGWIIQTDSLGNKLWDKTVFTTKINSGYAIQTKEGCFAYAGGTNGGIGGYQTQSNWDTIWPFTYDYWIIKFCDTTLTTSVNLISNFQFPISIYPNPTNSILNLFLNKTENITITNLIGEIIINTNAKGKVELDVSLLTAGIYFIKAGSEVRKFVKE